MELKWIRNIHSKKFLAKFKKSSRSSFTLIELLIVIAVVGILSVIVVLTINPVELLRRTRDSTRLSDFSTIQRALSLYQADVINPSLGTPNTLYLSLVDPAATSSSGTTCNTFRFLPLPAGWNYHCAASSTVKNINGTGWLPVNLTQISTKSPLGVYPIDPINTSSTGLYYAYGISTSSWELAAVFESKKYIPLQADDGGVDPAKYEIGRSLDITIPFAHQFVGFWSLNDNSGTTAKDSSGYNALGTLTNGPLWTTGKIGNALDFDGNNDFVNIGNQAQLRFGGSMTLGAWVYAEGFPGDDAVIISKKGASIGYQLDLTVDIGPRVFKLKATNSSGDDMFRYSATTLTTNQWYFIVGVYNAPEKTMDVYLNGSLDNGVQLGTITSSQRTSTTNVNIGRRSSGSYNFIGIIDHVFAYGRPLTAVEIKAMYDTTK